MSKINLFITLLWSCLCWSAQALSLLPNDNSARDAALRWLQLVDSGNYRRASVETAQDVRVPQHWLNYFSAHRARLGRARSRQINEIRHSPSLPIENWRYTTLRFKTSFERKPTVMEEVVLSKFSGRWEVSGYTIFTPGKWSETVEHAGDFSDQP